MTKTTIIPQKRVSMGFPLKSLDLSPIMLYTGHSRDPFYTSTWLKCLYYIKCPITLQKIIKISWSSFFCLAKTSWVHELPTKHEPSWLICLQFHSERTPSSPGLVLKKLPSLQHLKKNKRIPHRPQTPQETNAYQNVFHHNVLCIYLPNILYR